MYFIQKTGCNFNSFFFQWRQSERQRGRRDRAVPGGNADPVTDSWLEGERGRRESEWGKQKSVQEGAEAKVKLVKSSSAEV